MSISEQWKLQLKTPMGTIPFDMEIVRDETTFSGTVTGQGHTNDVSGTVEGNRMLWSLKIKIVPMPMDFTGDIDGDTMTGEVKAGMMGTYTFSGERI